MARQKLKLIICGLNKAVIDIFKITNNIIYITRGNSGNIDLSIADVNNAPYRLEDGDRLLFSVKKGCDYEDLLIEKTEFVESAKVISGETIYTYTCSICPSDTMDLEFGNYVYDIILYFANGDVNTIVNTSLFCICKAVGS